MDDYFIQTKARELQRVMVQVHKEICTGPLMDGWVSYKKGTNEQARVMDRYGKERSKYHHLLKQLNLSVDMFDKYLYQYMNEKIVGGEEEE